jgi:prepilin-type N-terminal cleavage/methylation domain-containing protein
MDYRCTSPSAERPHPVVPSRGFTLVELLVVIGIIALLLSIILPTIGRARDMGTRVGCGNNLRQLMLAVRNYSMDNDGFIPFPNDDDTSYNAPGWLYSQARMTSPASWKQPEVKFGSLWRYINTFETYHCPADKEPYLGRTPSGENSHELASYMMNWAAAGFGAVTFSQVPALRLTRMPADGIAFWEADETKPNTDMWSDGTNEPKNGLTPRHGKGATVARFDGGTEWYTRDEFVQMEQSPLRNPLWCNPLRADGHDPTP